MKREDITILQEIQKGTEMAMKSLDTIVNKVYDDGLSMEISRQNAQYSKIHHKVMEKMTKEQIEGYQKTALEDALLVGSIHLNTLLNTSTSHIADMIIQGGNKGVTQLCKAMHENEKAGLYTQEIAKELLALEEKSIDRLKKYL